MKEKEFHFVFLDFFVNVRINPSKMPPVLNKSPISIDDKRKTKMLIQIIQSMMKMICIN